MKSMKFQIRQANTDDDWDFFFKLSYETLKVLRKFIYDKLVEDNPDASDEELAKANRKETEEYFDFKQPDARVFIAESDEGARCGYLWMGMRNSRDAWDIERPQWIYDIVVDPKFRGHGLGSKLMQKAEEFSQEMNLNLGLFVQADNDSAIGLYRKEGYNVKNIPISKRMDEEISNNPVEDEFILRNMEDSDKEKVQQVEFQQFKEKVRFSYDADDSEIRKLFEKHLEKLTNKEEKHQKLIATTKSGEFVGVIWIGSSGFNEKIASIHGLAIDSQHQSSKLAEFLISSAEKWVKIENFTAIYMLLHAKDAIDLDFFKKREYNIPGFFMEKRLKE
jgi:ribosomal-protein-alanine N-acetyltransferase